MTLSSRPRRAKTILLADDEPYNLEWLVDYIESLGLKTHVCKNVDEAVQSIERETFRAVIADLGIPALDVATYITSQDPVIQRYPGLLIADRARNLGHTDRQVIVYSVYDDAAVSDAAKKLRCTYILKGRPRRFKEEITEILQYDPLAPG